MTKKLYTSNQMRWSVNNIILWINNDRPFYDRKIAIFKSLEKKKDKGIYDPTKAEKTLNYLTTDVRRYLNREQRENVIDIIGTTMPPAASALANIELRNEFEAWCLEDKELRAS